MAFLDWFTPRAEPKIEFICAAEDFGIIPEPVPAYKVMPFWYKALAPRVGNKGFNTSTLKRCNPFLDSLSAGYIIPLAADVYIKTNKNASGVEYEWKFSKPMIENHGMNQVSNPKCPNPDAPKPPMKFMNYWMIKTPPEYSLLFVPPLNREEKRFTCYSGIVDAPYPGLEYVNFPFFFNEPNFTGIIPAGTPLVQVIPIRKDALLPEFTCRARTDEEKADTVTVRLKRQVHESNYRDNIHRKL